MCRFWCVAKRTNLANVFKPMHLYTMKLVSPKALTLITSFFKTNSLLTGNPNDLVLKSKTTRDLSALATWESIPHLTPLNLRYDITPPELVTAVVTELAILPCTSVPVILRIQPSS